MSILTRVKEWADAEVLEANELNAEFDAIVDNIVAGTTAAVGLVQLEDSHASTSTTKAACPKNVKEAYDLANTMLTKAAFDAGTFIYAVNDNTPVKKTRAEILALLSGQSGADFSMGTHKITAVVDPTANQDAATKKYTDDCKVNKTTGAWSKSVASSGDYTTWAAMLAAVPDMIAHPVTVTIKAGTTLTETCNLKNKHGLTSDAFLTIQAEKYFPTSGVLPTVDSATATTLRDAALATAALGNDYFNGCWIFINHGTGTDNGPILITDYIDATGDVVVASWPGTQPDSTSRYLIVGALIDSEAARRCLDIKNNTCGIGMYGIGLYDASDYGIYMENNASIVGRYNGIYQCVSAGLYSKNVIFDFRYNGIVKCNTGNQNWHGGVTIDSNSNGGIYYSGISDNNRRGVLVQNGSFVYLYDNFGDLNGTWGTYAQHASTARCAGTECSGSSGNHSNGAGDGSLAY